MIDKRQAIESGQSLLIGKAIEQRKKLRLEKLDLIERLQTHDYSKMIAHARKMREHYTAQERDMMERQKNLPQTIQTIQTSREVLTKDIADLQIHLPKDAAGKFAKKVDSLDLSARDAAALIRLLQNAQRG